MSNTRGVLSKVIKSINIARAKSKNARALALLDEALNLTTADYNEAVNPNKRRKTVRGNDGRYQGSQPS